MPLTIEIAPELEGRIREAAEQEGLSPDLYILESINARLHKPDSEKSQHLSKHESTLLQKVNHSMDHINWARYHQLIELRQAERLTPEGQSELIALSNQLEEANGTRLKILIDLASLRQTTLPTLMKELGIKPFDHG